jgi:hypothetical protein
MPPLSELSSLLSDLSSFPLKLLFSLTVRLFIGSAILHHHHRSFVDNAEAIYSVIFGFVTFFMAQIMK